MKRILLPATLTALTAAWAVSLGVAQDGNGGNRGTPTVSNQPVATPSGAAEVPSANLFAALGGGITTDAYLLQHTPFANLLTLPGFFPTNLSGLSNLPGTAIFSMSGGMGDGGNVYHFLPSGAFIGVGASGFNSVPGLAWVNGGAQLVGSAAVAIIGDGLININPLTGAGATISPGGTYGGGIGGLDAIAQDPVSGTLFGSTGFFFDGSPGDEIVINLVTGGAMKTGVMAPIPTCTVAGMAFDNGGTGYISIGCGPGAGGNIYSWNPTTNAITLLGNANGSAKSVTDIEALF
jgi:hypothetical protein